MIYIRSLGIELGLVSRITSISKDQCADLEMYDGSKQYNVHVSDLVFD